jgi:hypothetical protein
MLTVLATPRKDIALPLPGCDIHDVTILSNGSEDTSMLPGALRMNRCAQTRLPVASTAVEVSVAINE